MVAAANASTFCAFEAGLAAAMEKPVFIVSLDGAAPPSHLQHIQSADVPRVVRSRPWLTAEDAALEAVLDALGSFASRG